MQENDLQADIDTILSKLKLSLECKEQSTNHKNIEPITTLARTSLQNGKQTSKKNLSSRLSMYSIDVSNTNQRKNTKLRRKSTCLPVIDYYISHLKHVKHANLYF